MVDHSRHGAGQEGPACAACAEEDWLSEPAGEHVKRVRARVTRRLRTSRWEGRPSRDMATALSLSDGTRHEHDPREPDWDVKRLTDEELEEEIRRFSDGHQ